MKDAECIAFLQWALPQINLRWAGFRKVRRQVCKRIARRLDQLGLADLDAYRARLAIDPAEWSALDAMCRVTISRFYRDRGVFQTLAHAVLPNLADEARAQGRDVACWSAGCASGEEVYTLKIIWDAQVSPHHEGAGLTVIGTDVDDAVLERARVGCYQRGTLREMPSELIARCFDVRGDRLCVKERHRRGVSFLSQDIRSAMPPGPLDIILCRNLVFTYFAESLQERILAGIATRLRRGGYLVIGAHENLPETALQFSPLPECRQILRYSAGGLPFNR